MSEKQAIKVGDPIWRCWDKDKAREYFIDNETTRSWMVKISWRKTEKVNKKFPEGWLFSRDEVAAYDLSVAELQWYGRHSYKISQAIKDGRISAATLRQIAALIGYDDGESGVPR